MLKRVSFVGIGRVGLCTAAYFAYKGCKVIASSNNPHKVELVRKGQSPFFEPELDEILEETVRLGKLQAELGRETAILNTDITFITVGTPSLPDGAADLTYLKETVKKIGELLKTKQDYHLIVVRSTVPPGTTENLVIPIIEKHSTKKAGKDFGVTMSPEFLREGASMYDIANPHRILIGEFDKRSGDTLEEFVKQLYGDKIPILRMSLASAELAKYASNIFLATKISFINQIANICERIPGVDVVEIACAMGLDPRIGSKFLRAGAGWGGSCFPKDTKALVALSRKLGYESKLIEEVISINKLQAKRMVELAEEELGNLEGKKIAILGLSFKPNTDDIREGASLRIINLLLAKGAKVVAFDPQAIDNVKRIIGDMISYSNSSYECLENADCCMLVTEWDEFKKLGPNDFTKLMRNPVLIDGRRIYDSQTFSKKLNLRAIGLSKSSEEN